MRATAVVLTLMMTAALHAGDGNRLTYLDENNPYYVSRDFPKLITPQWVGEEGVEAVVILGIDDMRDPARYEAYLRPILNRLKQVDGRAALSIMTCNVKPDDPQLQSWLEEGVSIECHTVDHPCPLLQGGEFAKAKSTYDRCVDLISAIPGNEPVAFRVPCCDSLNTPSPRFYAEIFNRTTEIGNFLSIDTSVFNIFTSDDPDLPREIVLDPEGRERFLKYIPKGLKRGDAVFDTFVNTIENYPYPYIINRLCWQFPCVVPSDWEAQHLQQPNNPVTVRDMKAAIDATVVKQGVFCLVFHPHGWIRNDQVVELIDHAVAKHGRKIQFLNFREALERINKNLLAGQPIRSPRDWEAGRDNGVRLVDLNDDGYQDVVIANTMAKKTRRWMPSTRAWNETAFPVPIALTKPIPTRRVSVEPAVRFAVLQDDGHATLICRNGEFEGGWHFDGSEWIKDDRLLAGLDVGGEPVADTTAALLRDLDNDGRCELISLEPYGALQGRPAVFQWSDKQQGWERLPFALPVTVAPTGVGAVGGRKADTGIRFVDLNEDGYDDLVFSDSERYGVYLFEDMKTGWSREVVAGQRGEKNPAEQIPPIVRADGTDNGFVVHDRTLFWQNEDTSGLPDLVDRRTFNDLLAEVEPEARSPEAALASMRVRPGFQVELVAAEPLVMDPVALAWGPDGKCWVVEMADYPLGIDGQGKHGGRVRYLEDTDGDGRYDKSTLFLDGIGYPSGVTPWHKGVLVSCAPDVLYAEDTDGDGKADVRETLYTGFVEGNQQHRINGFVRGLDNWLYLANGDSGGSVRSLRSGEVVDIRSRDLRIRPDEGMLDAQSGQTQFGRNRDDWGNWFGNNNSNPMYQFVLADHYLRRNPHVAAPDGRVQVSVDPGASPVYPISRTVARFNDQNKANRFTSANSSIVYRDELFGPAFAGNAFISEPVHNLVHREVMSAEGLTFTSRRAEDEQTSEFLASGDNWFRPTMLRTGPDGALWIADMYRQVIEHPEWIPDDWEKRLDLRAGHEKGRIYRVYPANTQPRPIPRLDRLAVPDLVAALDSPGGWQRDMAQQMLVWRRDKSAVAPLEELAATCPRALARVHALCTLEGLGALRSAVLVRALRDDHPGVRRHAIRLSETSVNNSPAIGEALLGLIGDPDPHVRLQLAYSLGQWDDARAGTALAQLAMSDGSDRFLAAAVMSSAVPHVDAMAASLLARHDVSSHTGLLARLLDIAVAVDNYQALGRVVQAVTVANDARDARWQWETVSRLLDTLGRRGGSVEQLHREGGAALRDSLGRLPHVFAAARATAAAGDEPAARRAAAVALLGRETKQLDADLSLMAELLAPQSPGQLQSAVVARLANINDARVPDVLLKGWAGYAPPMRGTVLDALLGRAAWAEPLLEAAQAHRVPLAEIDAARRQRMLEHSSPAVRQRAAELFAASVATDRRQVVEQHRGVLALDGSAEQGAAVFKKLCSACHKLGDVGNEVGPDLRALSDRSSGALLAALLDPNRAVEAKFVNYVAVTTAGLTRTGMLASEAGNSITLVDQDGKEHVLLRSELEIFESTGKSLMPEGLEKDLSPQDLADVIAFVASNQPPPKPFAGNKPELVQARSDGSLELSAANCAVYGPTLVFEQQYGNLGFWSSTDDRAVWSVDVPRTGSYDLWLQWACDDSTLGNRFVVEAGATHLAGRVQGTGNWDTYRREKIGRITLPAGRHQVTLRSAGEISGYLLDLKELRLVPDSARR